MLNEALKSLGLLLLIAISGCEYPAANPGEPDGAETSKAKGAVASGDLQVPRATKLLKCLCSDIIAPSSRQAYPVLANDTVQRQEKCTFTALENADATQKTPYLEVKVARVLSQNAYSQVVDRWRSRLVVNPKEVETKPSANDVQTIFDGEDGDYRVRGIALFKSLNGILITTEENAPKGSAVPDNLPPAYLTNVSATFQSLCE